MIRILLRLILIQCFLIFIGAQYANAEIKKFYIGEIFPFIYNAESGETVGAAIEVVTEMMAAINEPVGLESFHSISWPRAIEDVETREGMAIFCLGRTAQRENRFKWVGPIANINIGLVAKKSSLISIDSNADIKLFEIGVVRNSSPHLILEKLGMPRGRLTQLIDNQQQFRMLAEGRVDLITQADVAASFFIEEMGLETRDFEMVYILKKLPLYIAINKNMPDSYIEKLQEALKRLKRKGTTGKSRYDEILSKHSGGEILQLAD